MSWIDSWRRLRRTPFTRYAVAVLCVAIATLARLALDPLWGLKLPLLTFYPAVALAAWFGGLHPGFVTTILSAAAATYFWFPPARSFRLAETGDLVAMGLFVGIGVLLSVLSEALHRQRRYVDTLLESAGDGFVAVDRDWRVTRANERAAGMARRGRDEILGQRLWDVLPEVVGTDFELEARRTASEKTMRELQLVLERHGEWYAVRMSPIENGIGIYFQDITGRKPIEDAAERLAAIVQSSDDAIVSKTLEGIIVTWNPAAERMFGYSAPEVIGRPITIIIPPERLSEETEVLSRIRRGEGVDHFETVRVRKDGTRIDISLTVSPLRDRSGRVIGASKSARDITDRKRIEAERATLLAQERAARAEAETANRAKDEFLAVLSHELRTPLNAVYGWARMMAAGRLDATGTSQAVGAIVRNADAQVQLIDDLLDISRVITGKMRLDVRSVDLQAVVERALEAVRPATVVKEIRLRSTVDPLAGPVTGDPDRLQQVLWNLLMNAVKFTPRGGQIQVHVQRVRSQVEIVVSDTGSGIAPDVLPFIFDRFRQADSSSTRAHGGLGLGLSLVKHLVELHGGTVAAHSAGEGTGATFIVTLPVSTARIPGDPVTRPHPTVDLLPAPMPGVRLDGLRILAVDDDRDALVLVSAILSGAGATVMTSASAPDALEMLQRWRPHVLVSDIEMPGEDGYSLIRKVRALDAGRGGTTPAVAVTAYGRTEDRMRSLTAGYNMHVPKPTDPGELTTIIASLAGRTPEPV